MGPRLGRTWWLPAIVGIGSSFYLLYGPTITEGGFYLSTGQPVRWIRHLSPYQEHFRHLGFLPAFMLLYLGALLLIGLQIRRGRAATGLFSSVAIAIAAGLSGSGLAIYVPSLLLAAVISLGLAKGWRYALGVFLAVAVLAGGARLYARQKSVQWQESPVCLDLRDPGSGTLYPVPMFPEYYHPVPAYYVVNLGYDQAVKWYVQAFAGYGYRPLWVSRDEGHLSAEYGLGGADTPVLLLIEPWPAINESRVSVRLGAMARP